QRQLPERALHSLLTLIAGGLVRARPPVEVALKGLVVQVRNGSSKLYTDWTIELFLRYLFWQFNS
ncbi:hypothetical protein TYRP_005204, partial [Tyrophagus putrescentiae]